MWWDEIEREQQFRAAWESIGIARGVSYSLFTFGESILPYYLVCSARKPGVTVSITRGDVKITRPRIVTPDSTHPVFQNFFDNQDDEGFVDFLLARGVSLQHLKFDNQSGPERIVSDSVEEVVSRLNQQLDADEEDRIAVLTSPPQFRGIALLRYAAERVWSSAPDNIQELRERGFLP